MYEVDEVAQLTGLTPGTVRNYANRTSLVRGRDFTTLRRSRFGRVQHKLVFTKQGLLRIATRAFVRLDRAARRPSPRYRFELEHWLAECESVRPATFKSLEGRLRRKQLGRARLAVYLDTHPCRIPCCRCVCHAVANGIYRVEPPLLSPAQTFAF